MTHESYMQRCIQLARLGEGLTSPNPLVGSVVVYNNKIIGEGYHQFFGGPHAEVNAINSVINKDLLSKSTLYVNLEPCAHYGKTPPCADLIIQHKIPVVVIGCRDPFKEVDGKGIDRLKKANVEVITDVLEAQSHEINKRFFTFHLKKRPWILLKWAKSPDHFMGQKDKRTQISNNFVKMAVHKWRSEEAAIMVGTNTVTTDNPLLTVRDWFGKNPIRVIPDQHGRLNEDLHIFDESTPTVVFNARKESHSNHTRFFIIDFSVSILQQILSRLYEEGILSVMVEGGAALLNSFINENLWDEAIEITGNKVLGEGIDSPELPAKRYSIESLGSDTIQVYKNKNSAGL